MSDLNGVALNPAYGRKYTKQKDARADFLAGKDFIINAFHHPADGQLCSVRDFVKGDNVKLLWINAKGYKQYCNVIVK